MKVIRGGTVVTAADATLADVLIDGETIAAVGSVGDVDAEVIDATGCFVLPGAVDPHTHLKMPFGGTWSIDDYDTGTQAAAAGGTTCIVDFALQMHPDGLVESLAEWQGRAAGTAHVDYGFHMAITNATAPTIADMAAMIEAGVTTFKVFLAYRGVLMVTDDQFLRVLQESKATGGLVMVHAENGDAIDLLVHQALAAGRTEPTGARRDAAGDLRGRGDQPRRAARRVRRHADLHRPRHLPGRRRGDHRGRARGVDAMGETCIQYLTLDVSDLRAGPRRLRGRPLRLLAAAARPRNQPFLWDAHRARPPAGAVHRPLPVQRRAEGARPRRLLEDPERPGADPAPREPALGARRARGPAVAEPRASSCCRPRRRASSAYEQGRAGAGQGRRHRDPRPEREHVVLARHVADGGRLRRVRGPPDAGSVRTTLVARHDRVGRRTIHTQPGHGRFVARSTYGGT